MAQEIIITLTGLFCTVVSGVVTFLLTKRKYNVEVDSNQIDNVSKSFDLYKKMMEETLESQKRATEATINAQNEKIVALQKDYDTLKEQYNKLQEQMISILMGSNTHKFHGGIPSVEDLPVKNV